MKWKLFGTAGLSLIFLAAALAPGQEPKAGTSQAPQSSGKSLVMTASMPEDHAALVKYFQDLASQEQALAKSYSRIAKIYQDKTLPPGLDPASARDMKNQLRRLAETEKRAAEAAVIVAAYHARLAELVGRLPVVEIKQANPQDAAFRR